MKLDRNFMIAFGDRTSRVWSAAVVMLFAALLWGCSRPPPVTTNSRPALSLDNIPHSRDADDVARFIAGLPGVPGAPFVDLETSAAWKEHRRLVDQAWSHAEAELIGGLQEFQNRELNDALASTGPLFYPFGGPDSLTPTVFFPHSKIYVMVGLEPAGTLPSVAQIRKKNLAKFLPAFRRTIGSELGRSFFITREMDRQFRGQVTDGLLLPIILLLARTDHTIVGFQYVRLDDNGETVARPDNYISPAAFANKGIEIEFRTNADQSLHRLFYFSVNLSDERLGENKPFLAYVARLRGAATLLKATSYMTHRRDFSIIRDLMLNNSSVILQDDSGIPYHCFGAGQWKLQLYGDYTQPYGSFRFLVQPDLRKAYQTSAARPLPMHIGYGYRKITSNLLLAKRVTAPAVH
jgi:hypothetical protein